jgi:SHS2 domain-containing protein
LIVTFRYEFLPDVATADAAFHVKADNWDQLFAGASEALTSVMIDLAQLGAERRLGIEITAGSVEELLYDWLCEMVYLKDAEAFLAKSTDVRVEEGAVWHAKGELIGDTIRPGMMNMGQDVKAVTYHLFQVSHSGAEFSAQVVLDI